MPSVTLKPEANTAATPADAPLKTPWVKRWLTIPSDEPVTLYYELHGSPKATRRILFLCGLNALATTWLFQTRYFAALPDYQVCVFDNRGVGLSSAPAGRYSTALFAQDAARLLDHLGWTRNGEKVHLVGTSMGGMIAQELALLIPEHTATVALLSTHAGTWLNSPTAITSLPRIALASSPETKLDVTLGCIFPAAFLDAPGPEGSGFATNRDRMRAIMVGVVADRPIQPLAGIYGHFTAALLHRFGKDRLKRLAELLPPVAHGSRVLPRILVASGTTDLIISPHHSLYLADALSARLELFIGSGHALALEQPDRLNALLRAHIEETTDPSRNPPRAEAARLEALVPVSLRAATLVKIARPTAQPEVIAEASHALE